ncbi:hypothetical protein CALVIDRAFT_549801 [Calocera viscosa TUFC12733]|uniref:NCS1 nucleoside transporter family n=1 Tax=Calocera viscosa (strain TUFC12733) TaxID=1330018 RepID=A0A167LPZ4_CALVF|nr:hypothetical protein CALVIDRAFT_549801 [Calocera viscosa TUFC12733]
MSFKEKVSYWAKRLEVPADEDARYKTDIWCNRDLIPIPKERRTWGIWGYCGYWTVSGSCVSAWTIGSTMLSYGLNAQQAMACVAVGGVITGLLAIGCGWMGEVHHIGFTVSSRFSYGMRGAYIPVVIRSFTACMWAGLQLFWCGQSIKALIGAIIPEFEDGPLKDPFSETSQLAKNDFIGFIIALTLFAFLILVPPEKMQRPFIASFTTFVGTMFGMLIWAVHTNHGSAGPLFKSAATTDEVGWGIMYGITAMIGSWGAGCLGQSDWTRYANRRGAPTMSQLIFAPIFITITALIGVVVTSCTVEILQLETIIWNPIDLLPVIQQFYGNSSAARAAVFFASIGLVLSQLAITVVLNSVSCGMDMAGLAPRWINIRRGGYIMIVVGVLSQPWTLVATAQRFLTVLSGFGVFMAPFTGVMLADYLVVRKRKLKLSDLYRGDSSSIYWYSNGFNWRGFLAFGLGTVWLLPGLIATGGGYNIPVGWLRLFNLTFILGTVFSFTAFLVINYISPPPGLGEAAPFYLDGDADYATKADLKADSRDEESATDEKIPEAAVTAIPAV